MRKNLLYLNLRSLRHLHEMTLKDVAKRIGISETYICQLEDITSKRKVSLDICIRLANLFECSLDDLVFKEEVPKISKKIVLEKIDKLIKLFDN